MDDDHVPTEEERENIKFSLKRFQITLGVLRRQGLDDQDLQGLLGKIAELEKLLARGDEQV